MFNPVSVRIVDLLTATAQFAVPKYQRGYEWKHAHAEELLQDLQYFAEDPEEGKLFLGTCIFQKGARNTSKLSVVDGQQRLTTITLLLVACRSRAAALGMTTLTHSISEKVSFRDNHGEYKGPKLIASPTVRELYEHLLQDEWDEEFPARVAGKSMRWQKQRLEPVYKHFSDVIADYGAEDLKQLLDATYESIVIRIDVEDDLDALSIFERTNARGQDLEIADLLKNHLYQHQVSDLESLWTEICDNAGTQLLRMIKQFVVSERGYVQKKMIYRQLKRMIQEESAEIVTKRLLQFSRFFAAISKGGSADALKRFLESIGCSRLASIEWNLRALNSRLGALRSFQVSQHVPALYSALNCMMRVNPDSEKPLLALAHAVERYHFVNTVVCRRLGNEVERVYADFALECSSSNDLNASVQRLIGSLRTKLRPEEEYSVGLSAFDYNTDDSGKFAFFFDRVLNVGKSRQDSWVEIFDADDREWIRRTHEIEHFLAQKPQAATSEEDAEWVHNIGNLLVVSNATNNRLSNKPAAQKVEILKASPEVHYNYVDALLREWDESVAKLWNAESIRKRAARLASMSYQEVFKL